MAEVAAADPAASLRWYRDVLGLPVLLTDPATGFALLGGDGGRLALRAGAPAPGGLALHVEVSSLDAELARLAGVGVVPDGPVKASAEGYRRAVVRDPDGYAVVLFEWVRA
jgi:catechol 2,3-dioxygenase-like lactoylglutathione lyase family enzyme